MPEKMKIEYVHDEYGEKIVPMLKFSDVKKRVIRLIELYDEYSDLYNKEDVKWCLERLEEQFAEVLK